jgi:EmrB/QacA subfamily drug resistance transporter
MRKWLPLVAVCLGTFMLLIDVTIVNVALPQLAGDLETPFSSLQWVVDGYALALAAVLLGAGSLADISGRKRLYLGGLAVFALASLACGLAPNADALVAARVVQGIGGAAMFATTIALLNIAYRGRDLGTAFGIWGAVSGAAAATGPIAGGLLTEHLSWRWIFFVNLPISLLAIGLTIAVVTDAAPRPGRVDLPGVVTFTLAAASATYGFIRAGEASWSDSRTLLALAVAAVALVVFVAVERRAEHPMIDLALLRTPSFAGTLLGAGLLSVAAFAYLVYTSLWVQFVLGLSPVQAGLVFLPLSGAAFVTAAVAGRMLHGASPRWTIGGGLALIGVGALLQSGLDASSTWRALLPGLFVAGIGAGVATPSLASAAMAAVPPQLGGMAAGAVNTLRQLGFAFGIALLGAAFSARAGFSLDDPGVPDPAAFASGLSAVNLAAGVTGLVGAAVVVATVRRAAPAGERPAAPADTAIDPAAEVVADRALSPGV